VNPYRDVYIMRFINEKALRSVLEVALCAWSVNIVYAMNICYTL